MARLHTKAELLFVGILFQHQDFHEIAGIVKSRETLDVVIAALALVDESGHVAVVQFDKNTVILNPANHTLVFFSDLNIVKLQFVCGCNDRFSEIQIHQLFDFPGAGDVGPLFGVADALHFADHETSTRKRRWRVRQKAVAKLFQRNPALDASRQPNKTAFLVAFNDKCMGKLSDFWPFVVVEVAFKAAGA